eukprot:gnl/TRDRNA2_/TRDRNA2_155723_c2_seq1.p1 gnl/TRDRNA2_/TRDRNA2_155723_c2~~gnl/TRDRNA2_/TRDRNA2_155723_c2_seq1.p1  ORF type:complete len:330 (-),score=39.23 gnl/TRDRNA2_/TRDRNA2_155723_c2_seq1:583-1539(-)
MVSAALLLNIFVQVFFCVMATGPMIKAMKIDANDAKTWRETAAHSKELYDPITGASLVKRVCTGDGSLTLATMQSDTVFDIGMYEENYAGVSVGMLLCTVIMAVWFLTMAHEIVVIYQHFVAYSRIPKHWRETRFVYQKEDHTSMGIESLSYFRSAFMTLLLLFRMSIACTLLISGGIWLCQTFAVPDLVLNGAALAFILEIDELIFNTLVPVGAECLVRHLDPIRIGKPWRWKGLGLRTVTTLVGCIIFLSVMVSHVAIPFRSKLKEIMMYMCDGDKDFIFEKLESGRVMFRATSVIAEDTEMRKRVANMVGLDDTS